MTIKIYPSYTAFKTRPDTEKHFNGVSQAYINNNHMSLGDITLDDCTGCWNCTVCKNCHNCINLIGCVNCMAVTHMCDVVNADNMHPKISLITGVMGAGKSELAIICYNVLQKITNSIVCATPNGNDISCRNGQSIPAISVSDFLDSKQQPEMLIIDEYQFLSTDTIDQMLHVDGIQNIYLFGIRTTFKLETWESYDYLIDSGASETRKSKPCDSCHQHMAEHNILLNDNKAIVRDGDTVVPERRADFVAICTDCLQNWHNR